MTKTYCDICGAEIKDDSYKYLSKKQADEFFDEADRVVYDYNYGKLAIKLELLWIEDHEVEVEACYRCKLQLLNK